MDRPGAGGTCCRMPGCERRSGRPCKVEGTMTRGSATSRDLRRFGGSAVLLLGTIVLVLVLLYSATAAAYGSTATMTPVRSLFFLAAGLGLALGGYRAACGAWSGSPEVLHWSAAISGLLFIASAIWRFIGNGTNFPGANRGAVVFCLAISSLALVTWIRRSRRPGRGPEA